MLITLITILNTSILSLLGLLHLYWAYGGRWGFAEALPTNEQGERVLNPKKMDSTIVGIGLSIFAIYLLWYGDVVSLNLPWWVLEYGIWVIIIVFSLRAIGDFKYIGLFKKIRHTEFAGRDTRYYTPLCLWLSLSNLGINFLS